MQWHVGSRLEVVIDDLAAGGDGVGRVDGCVIFVPGSAPGDRLLVEVERVESRRLHASIVDVLEPSSVRREPLCIHFGRCGGCAWQHVTAEAQRAAKGRIVQNALERLGGIRVDGPIEVRAADEYGWRSRAQLHLAGDPRGTPSFAYLRRGSHALEVVEECPVLTAPLQRKLDELRTGTGGSVPPGAAGVRLLAAGDDVAVAFEDAKGRPMKGGPSTVRHVVNETKYELDARSFVQGNERMLQVLVDTALEGCVARRGGSALDLYCGAGLFTLPLAARFERVTGVEEDARAIELARSNATANGVGNARFEREDVGAYLHRARRVLEPEVVFLDPPRRGAGNEVVDRIAALAPDEVRYVSCDPATLARDLARFSGHGFTLASIVALDLFPQTPHVECVAILRRAPEA